jgi:hypothetical protein
MSTRPCWDINISKQPICQQRAIIIVTDAPVDEQIGCWNMVRKQYEEVECVAVE